MKKIKYILKELSGGQELTMKQRGIFMWWSLSLTFAVIFAECLWLCFLMVASFGIATHYLKQVPIPDSMIDINPNTRLIDLTVGQLLELIESAKGTPTQDAPKERRLEYGIAGIARIFNCSISTANRIKASGKIDKAISQRGRLIVIDAEKAIELFNK